MVRMAENKSGYIHSKDICDMIKTHSYIPTYVRIKIADCCIQNCFGTAIQSKPTQ